uniref:Uncharacterized protein n=1 Tax=Arundo donax TaxID=35708 RepID=A0A0A8Y9K3_ARUDO
MSFKSPSKSSKLLSNHPFVAFILRSSSIKRSTVNSFSQPFDSSYKRSLAAFLQVLKLSNPLLVPASKISGLA